MKRAINAALCAALALFLWGCGDDDIVNPTELEPPSTLTVTGRDDATLDLQWGTAVGEFVGYRIYAHTASIRNLTSPTDLAGYQIGGDLGSAQYTATIYLPNSYTYYYVHVRAYTEDGNLSAASPEVHEIARPEGANAVVYEFSAAVGNASGFDLSTGLSVSMANTNADRHDLTDFFVGYSGGTTGGGDLYLWSPKKANTTYENTAGFYGWPGTFDSLTEVPGTATFLDNVAVSAGKVIAVRVTDENAITHYAKVEIVATGGASPNRTVTFKWAYQPEPNRPELVPQP